MPRYKLTDSEMVIRLTDNAWIPPDPANRDWQLYEQFLEDGGTPDPPDPPPEPPAAEPSLADLQAEIASLRRQVRGQE